MGTLRTWEIYVLQAELDGRCGAWLLCTEGLTKGPSKGSLYKFQQSRFEQSMWPIAALVVFTLTMRQHWKLAVIFFYDNEGDIRERNQVLRKITVLSHKHWILVQLTIFKICFHLIAELVSPDDITLSLLGTISAKALQLDIFSKDSLADSEAV